MPDANAITWLIVPIAGPLALALAAFVLGDRWGARLGMVATVFVVVSDGAVTANVWRNGPQTYPLGNWSAPLGIALYADGLSCAMLLMSAAVGTVVSVYAIGYFPGSAASKHDVPAAEYGDIQDDAAHTRTPASSATHSATASAAFWPLWLLLWCALHALFLSRDVFNLYVTLELVTLPAIGLVALAGTYAAVESALRYLLAALVGSLLYLAGVVLLYGTYGALDITTLHTAAVSDRSLQATLVLVMLGLMLKTALFPFHFWLPPAHSSAPAPVSAMLSALVVKGSFYILLRLWFDLFPYDLVEPVAMLPAALGAAAILWGSLQALVAERLKMLVAYSTVAQLGYLFLVFGLARPASGLGQAAWSAGVLFALSHALAKSALFLAAGTILHVAGHDRVRDLSGVSRRLPITFFAIGVASISLMGLPPTGVFVAKWTMLKTAFAGEHVGFVIVMLAGGLLAAAYLFRVLAAAFTDPGSGENSPIRSRAPFVLECSTLVLALASLLLGLASWPLIELIQIGSPWPQAVVEGAAL